METTNEYKSYRPSKAFLIRGGIAAGTIALILIFQTNWFINLFDQKPNKNHVISNETIGGLVGKDSNSNGIPDWEEKLWGLDPTVLYTNGVSNKEIINQKKIALGVTDNQTAPLNETDLLAQKLFSISTAVGQSDSNSDSSLANIGAELGKAVDLSKVTDHYSFKDLKTTNTSTASIKVYYASMKKIVAQYKNETSGIDIIASSLETGDFSQLPALKKTAASYINVSKSLQNTVVPIGIADYHLALMNGFYGMAQSFSYILQMQDNGVNGLAGIGIYKNYSAKVDQAISDMNDYFVEYGIIQ